MNKKKLLALLMALVMTLSLMPMTVIAEELGTVTPIAEPTEAVAVESVSFEAMNEAVATDTDVAKIGDTGYATLKDAFAAATDGDTITLLGDCNGDGIKVDTVGKFPNGLTVDFGGHTYSVTGETVGSAGTETIAFQLYKGNKITFKNGTITGDNTVNTKLLRIIQNYSDLTLDNMTISLTNKYINQITVSNCCGTVVIKDSRISAPTSTNGNITTGCAAMAVGTFNGYNSVSVDVTGTSVITGDIKVEFTNEDGAANLSLTGGTVNGSIVLGTNADKVVVTKDNSVAVDAPAGYYWQNGTLTAIPENAVAQIGETKYATLAEAFEHAQDNDKIILLTDTSVDSTITVGSMTVELDLNGHVVTNNAGTKVRAFELSNDTNFTVTGTTAGSGMVNSAAVDGQTYGFFRIYNKSNATLTVNGGTYTGNTDNGAFVRVSSSSSGTVVNLTNVNVTTDCAIFDNTNGGAVTLTMTGGTYTQNNVVDGVGKLDSENKPVGAIHATYLSTLVMKDVTLTSMGGTGVAVETQSTATLENCTISITGTENKWASCAVGIGGLSTVTLDGGTYTSGLHGVSYYTSGGVLIVDGDATITGAADGIAYFYDTGYYSNLWKDYFPDGVPFYTNLIDGTINNGLVSYNNGVTNAAKNDSVLVVEGGKINGDYTVGGTVDTYDITGGKFTANPSDYVATGYEAVALTGENEGKWQVGKVQATNLAKQAGATEISATYEATKKVVDSTNPEIELATGTTFTVAVNAPTENLDANKEAVQLSNIDVDEVVSAAVDKASEEGQTSASVTVQLAKEGGEDIVESGNTKTATFEVHPEAIITVKNAYDVQVGEATTVKLTNDQIKGAFSFKLTIPTDLATVGEKVTVIHRHSDNTEENLGAFTVANDHTITLTGISSFSEFIATSVSEGDVTVGAVGASLRRRVLTSDHNTVVNTSTDYRVTFDWTDTTNKVNLTESYMEWSNNGTTWHKVSIANTADMGSYVTRASVVITGIPSTAFSTTIKTRIHLATSGDAIEAYGPDYSVNVVADKLSKLTGNETWSEYGKYLLGTRTEPLYVNN